MKIQTANHTSRCSGKLIFTILLTQLLYFVSSQTIWVEQVSGVTTSLNSVVNNGNASPYAWVCGNNGVVLRTYNTGTNWINVGINGIPTDINLNTICEIYSNVSGVLVAGVRLDTAIVYRTTNNGTNWQVVFRQYQGYINGVISGYQYGFIVGNPVGGRWSIWKTTNPTSRMNPA